jgi:ferrous iron transport protein B
VVDTPGTYSLFPKSPEELVAVKVLFETPKLGRPRAVICVADSTQLSRHLFLLRQLKEAGFPVILALTMGDLAEKEGFKVDPARLSEALGVPVVPVDGRSGKGIPELLTTAEQLGGKTNPNPLAAWTFEKQWKELQTIASIPRRSG